MRRLLSQRSFSLSLSALLLMGLLAGCGQNMEGGGPDVDFIREKSLKTSEEEEADKNAPKGPLLPLIAGSVWRMQCIKNDTQFDGEIKVMGTRTIGTATGTLIESRRKGKLYRLEMYRKSAKNELQLVALGEDEKNLLQFNPPVTLYQEGAELGSDYRWTGVAKMGKTSYQGMGYSRLSSTDKITGFSGEYDGVRLDSIITIASGKQRVDFPLVQWMVPGTGIVQRRLADKGTAVTEILVRYAK